MGVELDAHDCGRLNDVAQIAKALKVKIVVMLACEMPPNDDAVYGDTEPLWPLGRPECPRFQPQVFSLAKAKAEALQSDGNTNAASSSSSSKDNVIRGFKSSTAVAATTTATTTSTTTATRTSTTTTKIKASIGSPSTRSPKKQNNNWLVNSPAAQVYIHRQPYIVVFCHSRLTRNTLALDKGMSLVTYTPKGEVLSVKNAQQAYWEFSIGRFPTQVGGSDGFIKQTT